MNQSMKLFLESMLTHNIVFVLFFGTLLPCCAGLTVKRSLAAGLKFAVVLIFAGILAMSIFAMVPGNLSFLNHVAVLFVSVAAARTVLLLGELQGEWAGMPRYILFIAPAAGFQTYLWTRGISGLNGVLVSFGAAFGLYIGTVIITALLEQLRIAEAPVSAKRTGALFFAIAILALGFAGFQFL